MCNLSIILTIFTSLCSLLAAIGSFIGICRKNKLDNITLELEKANNRTAKLQNELYNVYLNVDELLKIEENLSKELEIGKRTSRKGYQTNKYIEPKRVKNRIKELEPNIYSQINIKE